MSIRRTLFALEKQLRLIWREKLAGGFDNDWFEHQLQLKFEHFLSYRAIANFRFIVENSQVIASVKVDPNADWIEIKMILTDYSECPIKTRTNFPWRSIFDIFEISKQ